MAIKTVLEYPHPQLREVCKPVTQDMLVSGQLAQIITDLKETLYATPGTVGLAAPQIGENYQLFVMDATANTNKSQFKLIINPVLTNQSKWKYGREGCLSFPQYLITIKRARKLTANYLDEALQEKNITVEEFEAVIFQHEYDHLQGVLFIDLARNLETDLMIRSTEPV